MTIGALELGREVPPRSLRQDSWWKTVAATIFGLGAAGAYLTWAAFQNGYYYAAPYLSPLYSPCLSSDCQHITFPIFGTIQIALPIVGLWVFSPALFILWIPLGFRGTCYYYRKAYYRAFFFSPPACAVPDAGKRYTGETRFPFILQNAHRYFFWISLPVIAFLWIDVFQAFVYHGRFMIGLGTLVLLVNTALLTFYTLGCHAGRHLCGGGQNHFSKAPIRFRLWRIVTRLNERHQPIAWVSLAGVSLADLYVRLVAMGVIQDPRIVF